MLVGHEVQVSLVCSVLALYFPLSQSVHAAADELAGDDDVALNLPAAQAATQRPLPEPYVPTGQTPQAVLSRERPVPTATPQHSPLAQVVVQAEAPVTECVSLVQLFTRKI